MTPIQPASISVTKGVAEVLVELAEEIELLGATLCGHPGFAAHQAGQLAGDRQAQPGAAKLARRRSVGLLECIKNMFKLPVIDTDAGIGDFKADHRSFF